MPAVGVHSSAIACGMILDEGRVWGWMLFTLCSVTSLSWGLGMGIGDYERRRGREGREGKKFVRVELDQYE
jgi:hypothetical protein